MKHGRNGSFSKSDWNKINSSKHDVISDDQAFWSLIAIGFAIITLPVMFPFYILWWVIKKILGK